MQKLRGYSGHAQSQGMRQSEQDSCSKKLNRGTNLNCLWIRIAPATLPEGFSVSKVVLE